MNNLAERVTSFYLYSPFSRKSNNLGISVEEAIRCTVFRTRSCQPDVFWSIKKWAEENNVVYYRSSFQGNTLTPDSKSFSFPVPIADGIYIENDNDRLLFVMKFLDKIS